MATSYKISGETFENGVVAQNLIVVYKADRTDEASVGQELGRATATADGVFEVQWNDYDGEIFVVCADPTPASKYEAKILDWVIGQNAGSDPYFDYVVSLLHMEGTDGEQIFLDEIDTNIWETFGEVNTSITQSKWGGTSARFDGDKDWIQIPWDEQRFNITVRDFCVEFWIYADSISAGLSEVFATRASYAVYGSCMVRLNNANIEMYFGASNSTWISDSSAGVITAQNWHHVAVSRDGSNFRCFIDGEETGGVVSASQLINTQVPITIGGLASWEGQFTGYLDDFRFTVGHPRYTGPFVPLSGPHFGNIDPFLDKVVAHLRMEGVDDGTDFTDEIGNVVTAFLNANTSADNVKFGNTSLQCDGTGSRLKIDYDPSFLLGLEDFTIECWYYSNVLTTTDAIFACRQYNEYGQFIMHAEASGLVRTYFRVGTNTWLTYNTALGALPQGTWCHLAVTRKGSTFRTFINGIQYSGIDDSRAIEPGVDSNIYLGGESNGGNAWDGYMDEFRLTVGVSRYNANFIPPQLAFPSV